MGGNGTKTPRIRDAERSRQAILDAAERLFARQGYQGTSLQDVGDAAGVSRGTPSYFFGSKDGLYRAVLERNFTAVARVLRDVRRRAEEEGSGPEGALRGQIEGYLDFLVAHPTFVRLVQWEALTGGTILGEYAPYLSLASETLASVEEAVGETGGADALDARHLLVSIIAMCWYPIANRDTVSRILEADPLEAGWVAARKRQVVELVLRALRGAPSGPG